MRTLAELRSNLSTTTRETQINSTIDEFINITLQEVNDPAWATKGYNHNWTFNRRKTSFTVTAETHILPRDVDKIALVRQTDSPQKIVYVPDELFYRHIPSPTETGDPRFYRLWEEEGVSTRLAVADTVSIVSSSASDGSSFNVTVVGYDSNGITQSEIITLNGTTLVAGTLTFAANRPLRISKSGKTTGTITVTESSGATTLVVLGAEERSPRFKVMEFYPIPTSITIYIEYFTRIRRLVNAADVPDIDEKWIWVVRQGALAKIYQYQNKPNDYIAAQGIYAAGVKSMVEADIMNSDYIPHLGGNRSNEAFLNWYFTDYTSV